MQPFAIFHEHPEWFKPLFAELDKRGLPYVSINPVEHYFAIEEKAPRYALFFNRMSSSAHLRGGIQGTFYTLNYLKHLENHGLRIINGYRAFTYETSKAMQLLLLQQLGVQYPKTRVVNHVSQIEAATEGLHFPVILKSNIGGDEAGVEKFDSMEELRGAVNNNRVDFGVDHTILVQEFVPARGGYITHVETLGGKYLYAVKVYAAGNFNGGAQNSKKVEVYEPPAQIIKDVENIVQKAGIDIGGVEYVINDRNGEIYYCNINVLSSFVNENKLGFNPYEKLVNFLEHEAVKQTEDIAVV